MSEKRVPPYPNEVQQKEELITRTFQYVHPFNYENVVVDRRYNCGEFHGLEMNPINSYWPETERRPADGIIIEEENPIVRVVVIGSACTPPGYVTLECEPVAGFRRDDEVEQVMPVRFRINGLWGMHLRVDQWLEPSGTTRPIPEETVANSAFLKDESFRCTYENIPLAGMSSALFEIPPSRQVIVSGGSETPHWRSDKFPDDAHYSFRIIRTTVLANWTPPHSAQ